ncbi:NAD(P)/FAD-dependent oxidoreductase (plasmid) [Rhodococcus pyridinivorans]|uniref:flavin-containing monooxygenase n=1 Tax=Rhodococcus TaxID=1827 RepID=UPI0007D90D9D|nr:MULTISPECIES: NAD(P)/FAD-dependent oxidoreductase [Rhodococcus]MCT7293672.1 NAD(P)/FAD-dependent oxidoreductase [Rhodococcus sp. PAE-6]QXU56453.1 NAD(P)/FAD-dependent oxidoreductase [Rhodococcus sp. LW-XY12]UQB75902.1 NAD(P)/FAD-dependent oxidoreductase [Rhodococcus ruber]UVT27688.1 NAD(P)/FAD-dependent oxidoreductase [Rhodococcus pyridinivorans]WML66325.1 NAD(P)/FAD-dependent oxidoreductase [Rhodococcus sp. AH-ZY2]
MPDQNVTAADHEIVVIGAGFGGIAMAVKLREAGIDDFVILERAAALGGTWRDNTYPGCACDVPSQLYSYSFAQNPDWTRTYGKQEEILAYLHQVADRYDVKRHIWYEVEMLGAQWNEADRMWTLETSAGTVTARVVVTAAGVYGEAKYPDIPGRDTFTGTAFHSLHWDHSYDPTGDRIAVIGTGASAVQFVPELQKTARRLLVFQRSAPWIIPRMDRITSRFERQLIRRIPLVGKAMRALFYGVIEGFGLVGFVSNKFRFPYELMGRYQLRRQVRDPELRKTLTPDYMIGCKRAIFSDEYLPALTRENVDVVTTGIAEIRPHSVVTRDGIEHEVDTIVYGTGFQVPPAVYERIQGVNGITYADLYRKAPQSYLGMAVAGFPNFFNTLGAFGAVGNQSVIYMIEAQVKYIVDAVSTMRRRGLTRVEVRDDVQDRFVDEMNRRSDGTVWLTGGCDTSYYHTADGKNAGLYPGWSFEYKRRVEKFDSDAYTVSTR